MTKPEDEPTTLVKLTPSQDWLATFWCVNCEHHHHMLLLKLRVHYKAVLVQNTKAHKDLVSPFGYYENKGGAPVDKILDDIEDVFGPEDEEDEDDDDD